jgi:hypothetical protein
MHSYKDRVSVFCSCLSRCGLFITSDWVFLVGWGLLLRGNRVFSIYHCCFGLFHLVVDIWSEEVIAK